jgi:hypothetical protein
MFHDLDTTLENILNDGGAPLQLRNAGVSFETPDKNYTPQHPDSAINLFLYEVKENRKLRTSEPIIEPSASGLVKRQPSLRVDCSYLVTAWRDGVIGATKVRSEHRLLGQAFFWLSRFPIIPERFFAGVMAGQPYPPPTMVAQWDVARNQGEFWTSLGIPPRPYFNLIVTIAMDLELSTHEYPVTATITNYQQVNLPESTEVSVNIGGHVIRRSGNTNFEIADAWVSLETSTGEFLQATTTNSSGQFIFERLTPGQYQLKARTVGFPEKTSPLFDVPSPSGQYDLMFP